MLKGIPHSFFQTWSYCDALQKSQQNAIEMLSIRYNESGLVVIYSKRSKNDIGIDIYSPYGFGGILIWGVDHQFIIESFETWMQENKIVTAFLMSHPAFDNNRNNQFVHIRSSYVLDLSASEDELWLGMADSHRHELKKLFKDSKITVTDDKAEILKVLPALYKDTLARVGAASNYFFSTETLKALVHDVNTIVLGGEIGGKMHAVVIICYSGECAEYFINATDVEGRNLTRLLLWEGMRKLRSLGIMKFNLGGGAEEGDQLEAYKKRFGGRKAFIPLYRKIVNHDQYGSLCRSYNKDPTDISYFPPYWKS